MDPILQSEIDDRLKDMRAAMQLDDKARAKVVQDGLYRELATTIAEQYDMGERVEDADQLVHYAVIESEKIRQGEK